MPYHVRDGGVWKEGQAKWVKDGGVWKEVQDGWIKDGGVWKPYYSAIEPYEETFDDQIADGWIDDGSIQSGGHDGTGYYYSVSGGFFSSNGRSPLIEKQLPYFRFWTKATGATHAGSVFFYDSTDRTLTSESDSDGYIFEILLGNDNTAFGINYNSNHDSTNYNSTNVWKKVELYFDWNNNNLDYYVQGNLAGQNLSFNPNATKIGHLRLWVNFFSNNRIDDIYYGSEP